MLRVTRPRPTSSAPWGLAWRLAFGQLVAWGALYYSFTVVIGPMQHETGWSRSFLNAGVSLGLLVSGLCAYPVGVWIHQHGARGIMTLASAVGGVALVLIGSTTSPAGYLVAWTLLGAAMAGVLYEPAFAVITERFGPHYQRGITVVTLVGGLASTVFIPLTHFAAGNFGWRAALIGLGVVQAVFSAALHGFGLPADRARPVSEPTVRPRAELFRLHALPEWQDRRFRGLALWFSAHAATFSGTILLLVPVIRQLGFSEGPMLTAVMLIGPMQVAGRVALIVWIERFPSLRLAGWATAALMLSLALVSLLPTAFATLAAFAILYGAANGIMTILRGTVVADLFGRERYALLNGALGLPSVLAKAAAPWLLASLWETTDTPQTIFYGALLLAAVGAIGLRMAAQVLPPAPAEECGAESAGDLEYCEK